MAADVCIRRDWGNDLLETIRVLRDWGRCEQGYGVDLEYVQANIASKGTTSSIRRKSTAADCNQVTQMPWLEKFWTNNPIQRYLRWGGVSPGAAFAMARVQERRELQRTTQKNDWHINDRDFLSRFMEIESNDKSIPPW